MLQISGCASSIELNSRKVDHPILIDGKDDDWQSALVYLKKEKLTLGFCDDSSSLYPCMATTDRETQQQIMGNGLTVWFDSTGSEVEILGMHFPLGAMNRERPTSEMSKQR